MAERARIARYFAPLTQGEPGAFNLSDDAAVLSPPAGKKMVITTDSVIQHIHVLADATPQQFAQKLVRRNLSDLTAMGAEPWRYTLNLHTPAGLAEDWFATFAAALAAEQTQFDMVLVGGDSTSGGNVIHTTMTCFGLVEGTPLRRSGAQVGDDLYVSGTVGDAALALFMLQNKLDIPEEFAARYHCPEPRIALGQLLQPFASSAIDISDGLMSDISQLCTASHVGACVMRDALPLSPPAQQLLQQSERSWQYILNGGDDYELLFTAHPSQRDWIEIQAYSLQLPLTRIGTITEALEVTLLDEHQQPVAVGSAGFEHR